MEALHQIYAIGIKELRLLWKDREALALLFLMPAFFILVMSLALKNVYEAGGKEHPIGLLVINEDRGGTAMQLIAELKEMETLFVIEKPDGAPLGREAAEALIRNGKYSLAIYFKEDFSEQMRPFRPDPSASAASVWIICDPAVNRQVLVSVRGILQGLLDRRRQMLLLPERIQACLAAEGFSAERSIARDRASGDGPDRVVPKPDPFPVQTVYPQSIPKTKRPTSTEQNVPGYTIFGVYFIVLTLASGFVREKKDGTFQRILIAPVSKGAVLVGKLLPFYIVNLIQIAVMFLIGVAVFHMDLGNLPALVLVSLALSATANGMGLMVAAVCRTEAQVNGLSVLLAVTLAALGGMMVPAFLMPGPLKTLSLFTPHAWALSGYQDAIIRGLGIRSVLPETTILFGFAAGFFAVALWRFRFDS